MPLAPTPARGCTLQEGSMHLLAAMCEFSCPHDFARYIIRHYQAAGSAAGIDLKAQWHLDEHPAGSA
jgi:hypothetical protein